MTGGAELGYAGESGRQRQGNWRVTQHTAKTQRAGDPEAETPTAGAGPTEAPGAEVGRQGALPSPGVRPATSKGPPRTGPDAAPRPASQPKPKAEDPGIPDGKKTPAAKGQAKKGQAKKGQTKKGGAGKGKGGKGKIDIVGAIKFFAGLTACLLSPLLVGEVLKAVFHLHKGDTILVNLALYPVFIILFIWLFVRMIFKPVADAGAKGTPLPPEGSDHGTRDDGSLLM